MLVTSVCVGVTGLVLMVVMHFVAVPGGIFWKIPIPCSFLGTVGLVRSETTSGICHITLVYLDLHYYRSYDMSVQFGPRWV